MSTKQVRVDVIELPGDLGTRGGCESFTLAIDIAAAGALDVVARGQLDRHLARCESCRGYREHSAEIMTLVADTAPATDLEPARWREIEARLVKNTSSPWLWVRRTALTVAVSMSLAFVLLLLAGTPAMNWRFWLVSGVAFTIYAGGLNIYKYRQLRRDVATRDVMSAHRHQLLRLVTAWRSLRVCLPFTGLVQVLAGFNQPGVIRAAIIVMEIVTFVMLWSSVRKARRELAVLS